MSRGILLFAHNNRQIDYGKIALANSCLIKNNMKNNHITLITDTGTKEWLDKSYSNDMLSKYIDNIVVTKRRQLNNPKRFYDTRYTKVNETFYNINRDECYQLTPYDETLVIDVDYLICNNLLDQCWSLDYDLQINSESRDLFSERSFDEFNYISDQGPKFYWATAFFFRKNKETELFFNLIKDIKINWNYYKLLYSINSQTYRNDFAFSIAVHMFNGMTNSKFVPNLPLPFLQHIHGIDDLIDVPDKNSLLFLLDKPNEPGKYLACKTKNTNVHVMNKFALNRLADKIIEVHNV
jgi:hypothetical protein|tara:strand:+ start:38212 stop:39096 length:885 start_codon:yes stop_codon:yes gene_type:complete